MDTPYTLKKPLHRANGQTISTIESVREATGADLLLVDQFAEQPMRLTMELIAAMAVLPDGQGGLTFADVKAMGAHDIDALGEFVTAALPDGPKTGPTG